MITQLLAHLFQNENTYLNYTEYSIILKLNCIQAIYSFK